MNTMQDKLNRAEYWLLDVVINHAEPMRALLPDGEAQDYFAGMFNREPLGLNASELLDTFCKMVDEGYIVGQRYRSMPFLPVGGEVIPSRQEISEELAKPVQKGQPSSSGTLYFKLSSKGGEVWEALSHPDWTLYVTKEEAYGATIREAFAAVRDANTANQDTSHIQNSTEADDQDANLERLHVQVVSANRSLAANYFALDNDYYNVVVPDTQQWRELSSWRATYWKTLPQGYEVSYSIYSNSELQERNGYISSHADLDQHNDRMPPLWYTNYVTGRRSG